MEKGSTLSAFDISDYKVDALLDKGSFGQVYNGKNLKTGVEVVFKHIQISSEYEHKHLLMIVRELIILRDLGRSTSRASPLLLDVLVPTYAKDNWLLLD